jgi:hypothetical protein
MIALKCGVETKLQAINFNFSKAIGPFVDDNENIQKKLQIR